MQNVEEENTEDKLIDLASDNLTIYQAAHKWFLKQGPGITSVLVKGLEDDMLGSLCHWRILLLLRHFADLDTLPFILKALRLALKEKNSIVLTGAMEALVAFHASEAISALIALLQERDQDIIQHAAVLLGQTGDTSAIEPLLALLKNDNPSIRYSAVKGLLLIDNPVVHDALNIHLESEDNPEVRELLSNAKMSDHNSRIVGDEL